LNAEEVRSILKRCDHRLYASLRDFRKGICEGPWFSTAEIARQGGCKQDLRVTSICSRVKIPA